MDNKNITKYSNNTNHSINIDSNYIDNKNNKQINKIKSKKEKQAEKISKAKEKVETDEAIKDRNKKIDEIDKGLNKLRKQLSSSEKETVESLNEDTEKAKDEAKKKKSKERFSDVRKGRISWLKQKRGELEEAQKYLEGLPKGIKGMELRMNTIAIQLGRIDKLLTKFRTEEEKKVAEKQKEAKIEVRRNELREKMPSTIQSIENDILTLDPDRVFPEGRETAKKAMERVLKAVKENAAEREVFLNEAKDLLPEEEYKTLGDTQQKFEEASGKIEAIILAL